MSIKVLIALFLLSSLSLPTFADEAKKEEVKKEEPKKEEPKKEEPKKEEPKKEEPKKVVVVVKVPKKPKECFYQTGSLAIIGTDKFEDEVKKIQSDFEKCESQLLLLKERESKIIECKKMHDEVKEKKTVLYKLIDSSSKIIAKDEFEKSVAFIKASKEEVLKSESRFKESCKPKEEVKKEEPKKEEPKKEEPKKEEVKKEEPKVEEHKK